MITSRFRDVIEKCKNEGLRFFVTLANNFSIVILFIEILFISFYFYYSWNPD